MRINFGGIIIKRLNLSKIEKQIKSRKIRGEPYKFFLFKFNNITEFIDEVIVKIDDNRHKEEAIRQHIVGLVTILEVYLKDMFIYLINDIKMDITNLQECRRIKDVNFKFRDLLNIKEKDISLGDLFAEQFNFQNLDDINLAFSQLLGIDFFSTVGKPTPSRKRDIFGRVIITKNWYSDLNRLISIRHDIVHNIDYENIITFDETEELSLHLLIFTSVVNNSIFDYLEDHGLDKNN